MISECKMENDKIKKEFENQINAKEIKIDRLQIENNNLINELKLKNDK